MNIYEEMNKIDDFESLNQKQAVKKSQPIKESLTEEVAKGEPITITYNSDWQIDMIDSERKEFENFGIEVISISDVEDIHHTHEVTVKGTKEQFIDFIEATGDELLDDALANINECLTESIDDIDNMRSAIDTVFSTVECSIAVSEILSKHNANEDDSDPELGYFMGMSDEDVTAAYNEVKEYFVHKYTNRTIPDHIRKAFSFDYIENELTEEVDPNMKKLRDAAKAVKCKLDKDTIDYALDYNGEFLDDFINDELNYLGNVLVKEFPEMDEWTFVSDDNGGYCLVKEADTKHKVQVVRDRVYVID